MGTNDEGLKFYVICTPEKSWAFRQWPKMEEVPQGTMVYSHWGEVWWYIRNADGQLIWDVVPNEDSVPKSYKLALLLLGGP